MAVRTSPGKRKQATLVVSTLKVVAYNEVVNCQVEWTFNASNGTKTIFCCYVNSL